MKRSVIRDPIEYPPTGNCFEMKGCAVNLEKGERASQKKKDDDNNHTLKTEILI